jgi:uncharacterized protein
MADSPIAFLWLLPIISFLYASVGHGGASGYLALLALFDFPTGMMKPAALLLNIFVAGISFYHYYRAGFFDKKLFASFAITSIPLAFLGGMIELDAGLYKKILAVLLVFAVLRMLGVLGPTKPQIKKVKAWEGLLAGGSIGFFSGLIGIGGGIILSPVILLMQWGNMKQAAAVSALFIWVNSVAGMGGQLYQGVHLEAQVFVWAGIALIGGYIGGKVGSKWMKEQYLRYMLAFVLAIACAKLMLT